MRMLVAIHSYAVNTGKGPDMRELGGKFRSDFGTERAPRAGRSGEIRKPESLNRVTEHSPFVDQMRDVLGHRKRLAFGKVDVHGESKPLLPLLIFGERVLDRFPVRNNADLCYRSSVYGFKYRIGNAFRETEIICGDGDARGQQFFCFGRHAEKIRVLLALESFCI